MTLFIAFEPPPYHFVTTLKGFVFLDHTPAQTEEEVGEIIRSTLFLGGRNSEATMRVRHFLASHHDNIPSMFQPMDEIVDYLCKTIDVEHLDLVQK